MGGDCNYTVVYKNGLWGWEIFWGYAIFSELGKYDTRKS